MTNRFEDTVARAARRWVAVVERHPRRTLGAVLAATVVVAIYAAARLGVNADPRTLIAADLPFQVRQRDLTHTFHTLGDGILVVVDADSPIVAARAADALAERLGRRRDLFTQVDVPGGGPFFARHALLYLEPAQLEELVTRLGRVQPFLAELAQDPSLVGIAGLLRQALGAERTGTRVGLELSTALDRVAATVEATRDRRPAPDPWGTALLGAALPVEARQRIVALRPQIDYGTLLGVQTHIEAIRQAALALGLTPARGVRVRITGEPVLNYEELLAIGRQVRVIAVVSFVFFAGVVVWALRSRRVAGALLASLLVGLVWSNAVAALLIGHLNQISATVNVLIIGLGGELQIHLCMRYVELVDAGRSRRDALLDAADSTGPALFSSACTTAIGFWIFLLTDFTGVAQLGLIAGSGMFLSLAGAFTVVPAILAMGAPPPVRTAPPPALVARLEHLPVRFAAPIRVVAVLVALGAAALLPRIRFDYNLLALRDPGTESVATFTDLLARQGTTPWTIDVIVPDLAATGEMARRLAALDTVARTRTVHDWVPTAQDEKLETLELAEYFVPAEIAEVPARTPTEQWEALDRLADEAARTGVESRDPALAAAARRLATALTSFLDGLLGGGPPGAALRRLEASLVGSLPEQLRDLRPLVTPERVRLQDLPATLTEQLVAPDGRARIEVFPRADVSDSVALERFVDSVRTVAPEATGSAVWMVEWGRVTWHAMVLALSVGMCCMVLFLVLLWRSAWDTVLAFFPLVLATALTGAAMALFGRPFNFANVIVLPMLVGMGVDNGVHLVHRHRTRPDEVDVLASSTARAVFYAALATALSFGSMGFASHHGIASFGLLLTLGVTLTLVCYVIVLPAVLEWDDRRSSP